MATLIDGQHDVNDSRAGNGVDDLPAKYQATGAFMTLATLKVARKLDNQNTYEPKQKSANANPRAMPTI
jgi:hypothetical protein